MPRSHWKGVISFGLVSIPVILYPTENKSAVTLFHQIDKRNNARIKYQRINSTTGKIVPWEEITRGYEYDKDTIIPVPDEILQKVAGSHDHTMDIQKFVDKSALDLLTIENNYYLAPDKKGEKGYVILREALVETKKIGITKVIISTKEYLAAIMPYQQALILCLLKYDHEMRKLSELELPTKELSAYKISKKEVDIAKQLIKAMGAQWHPEKYVDEYQKAIHQWIDESVNRLPHAKMKKHSKTQSSAVNFVELLKKSLSSHSKKTSSKTTKKATDKSYYVSGKTAKITKHVTKH